MFVDDAEAPALSGDDAHHLIHVLRLRSGAKIIASDGRGNYVRCVLGRVDDRTRGASRGASPLASLEACGEVETEPAPAHLIAVGFALHKGDRPDWAVQKLTELGVDRILLLSTARTVIRPDRSSGDRRAERLGRIAQQAASQARVLRLPTVEGPMTLDQALATAPTPSALAEPGAPAVTPSTSTILVGPEGGFSDEELGLAPDLVGLADSILRTETAAVAAGVLLSSFRSGMIAAPSRTEV
ncbi:MAG TPA: RsmE family RNA methyltransferase [Acidimicrobiales bacterium]|nr:RsmE family RNA methyltransferase [Acidimicrobiales bacterium]